MANQPSLVLDADFVFSNKALRRKDSCSSLNSHSRRSSSGSVVSAPGESSTTTSPAVPPEHPPPGMHRGRATTWDATSSAKAPTPSRKSAKKDKQKSRKLKAERRLKERAVHFQCHSDDEAADLELLEHSPSNACPNMDTRDTSSSISSEDELQNDAQRTIRALIRKCQGLDDEETEGHHGESNESLNAAKEDAMTLSSPCRKKKNRKKAKAAEAAKKKNRLVLVLKEIKNMTGNDIPLAKLCETPLANELTKLSLRANPLLGTVPTRLVQSLSALRTLDLSECHLTHLPRHWDLPCLRNLNLCNNRLREFPGGDMLDGLRELTELILCNNQIKVIMMPPRHKLALTKLEKLDLSRNFLEYLPDDLDQLKNLKVLLLRENCLTAVSKRVVEMDLNKIDVCENEKMNQPPLEVCVSEEGLPVMRRYYHDLPLEPAPNCTLQERSSTTTFSSKVVKKLSFGTIEYSPDSTSGTAVDDYYEDEESEFGSSCPATELAPGDSARRLLGAVVIVGLWDGDRRSVVRVGSGFVVDRKRGLIVTASHTLMNIWSNADGTFGKNYGGLVHGKVVIGVIPRNNYVSNSSAAGIDVAVWRYYAEIVTKDPTMKTGKCHLDACVLRITSRVENDVDGDAEACGDHPVILLKGNDRATRKEGLQSLKLSTDIVKIGEGVHVLGYGQNTKGSRSPDEKVKRSMDFVAGQVCDQVTASEENRSYFRFSPRDEIAVRSAVVCGHSGGPCVNQKGHVIGIVSRGDPDDDKVCYLSSASAWMQLIKDARHAPIQHD